MSINDLKKEQLRLAKKVITKDDFDEIKLVAGCDQSFLDKKVISAVVVLELDTLRIVEKKFGSAEAPIPYIPDFIGYREGPAIVDAISKLDNKPDVLIVDGNGILHPRKIGLASHAGILLDIPTIGVGKSIPLGEEKDGKVVVEGETRALVLKTKEYSKPIYVSPGHRVSLKTAEEIVRKCMLEKHKMPEPLHQAHKYSNKVRERLLSGNQEQKVE